MFRRLIWLLVAIVALFITIMMLTVPTMPGDGTSISCRWALFGCAE